MREFSNPKEKAKPRNSGKFILGIPSPDPNLVGMGCQGVGILGRFSLANETAQSWYVGHGGEMLVF